jgi:hypothetical protein
VRYVFGQGLFLPCEQGGDEGGFEGGEAGVEIGVVADVEEEVGCDAFFATGVLLEGEGSTVDEGEEDVEGAGALGGRGGGILLVVCGSRSASSEIGRVPCGERRLREGNGADVRCIIGLESDILYPVSDIQYVEKPGTYLSLKNIRILHPLERKSPNFHILSSIRMLDSI